MLHVDDAFDATFQVILPRKHPMTKLVVEHGNSGTVVNEIRKFYHISCLRTVVTCQWCKVMKAIPKVPWMTPLPVARLSSLTREFTYIGIGFSRPLLVKVEMTNAKRWICQFTCLTTRFVHFKVAHSLSPPSALLRRSGCHR